MLRLPRMSTLATPIHRLITPDKASEEAVTTGGGGDGGGAADGTAERLIFLVECRVFRLCLIKLFLTTIACQKFYCTALIFKKLFYLFRKWKFNTLYNYEGCAINYLPYLCYSHASCLTYKAFDPSTFFRIDRLHYYVG